jgi:hypothetical protein
MEKDKLSESKEQTVLIEHEWDTEIFTAIEIKNPPAISEDTDGDYAPEEYTEKLNEMDFAWEQGVSAGKLPRFKLRIDPSNFDDPYLEIARRRDKLMQLIGTVTEARIIPAAEIIENPEIVDGFEDHTESNNMPDIIAERFE